MVSDLGSHTPAFRSLSVSDYKRGGIPCHRCLTGSLGGFEGFAVPSVRQMRSSPLTPLDLDYPLPTRDGQVSGRQCRTEGSIMVRRHTLSAGEFDARRGSIDGSLPRHEVKRRRAS